MALMKINKVSSYGNIPSDYSHSIDVFEILVDRLDMEDFITYNTQTYTVTPDSIKDNQISIGFSDDCTIKRSQPSKIELVTCDGKEYKLVSLSHQYEPNAIKFNDGRNYTMQFLPDRLILTFSPEIYDDVQLTLPVKLKDLLDFSAEKLNEDLELPTGIYSMLELCLAVELSQIFDNEVSPYLHSIMEKAKRTVSRKKKRSIVASKAERVNITSIRGSRRF